MQHDDAKDKLRWTLRGEDFFGRQVDNTPIDEPLYFWAPPTKTARRGSALPSAPGAYINVADEYANQHARRIGRKARQN